MVDEHIESGTAKWIKTSQQAAGFLHRVDGAGAVAVSQREVAGFDVVNGATLEAGFCRMSEVGPVCVSDVGFHWLRVEPHQPAIRICALRKPPRPGRGVESIREILVQFASQGAAEVTVRRGLAAKRGGHLCEL